MTPTVLRVTRYFLNLIPSPLSFFIGLTTRILHWTFTAHRSLAHISGAISIAAFGEVIIDAARIRLKLPLAGSFGISKGANF